MSIHRTHTHECRCIGCGDTELSLTPPRSKKNTNPSFWNVLCAYTQSKKLYQYFITFSEYLIECRPYNCASIAPTYMHTAILVVEIQAELDRGFRYYVCCTRPNPNFNFVHIHALCVKFAWKIARVTSNLSHLQACAQLQGLQSYSTKTGLTP